MQEHIYQSPEISLNYAESNSDNPPLLLLHGGSSRWQVFSEIMPILNTKYHLYALDFRGHGKSGRANTYNIQDYTADVAYFIKDVIKKPTIIFGHSLGGEIAILLAALHPNLVKALIIGDSPLSKEVIFDHFEQQKAMTKQWRDWTSLSIPNIIAHLKAMEIAIPGKEERITASKIFGEKHPWFEFMALSLQQNDPKMLSSIIENYVETFKAYDMEHLFPLITCPVLILRGGIEQGSLIPDRDAKRALSLLKNGREKQIPHVGHALFMQDADAVVNAILDFI